MNGPPPEYLRGFALGSAAGQAVVRSLMFDGVHLGKLAQKVAAVLVMQVLLQEQASGV